MTPFRIRQRLKKIIDGTSGPGYETHKITFVLPDGSEQSFDVEDGYSVLMAADANGITISTGRRAGGTCPDGACGSCRVEVIDGRGLSAKKPAEQKTMDDHAAGLPHEGRPRKAAPKPGPNTRLGCHARIVGNGSRIQIAEVFDLDSVRGDDNGL